MCLPKTLLLSCISHPMFLFLHSSSDLSIPHPSIPGVSFLHLNHRTVLNPYLGYLLLEQITVEPSPGFPVFPGEMRALSLPAKGSMSPRPEPHPITGSESRLQGQDTT